jgi:hypothetical protein
MGIFRLAPISVGPDPNNWPTLESFLSIANMPADPNANFRRFSNAVDTLGGNLYGRGFSIATWELTGLIAQQRISLRTICPGLSAAVYIETMTNDYELCTGERAWIQASSIMKWPAGEEDIQAEHTLDLLLQFTRLVEI